MISCLIKGIMKQSADAFQSISFRLHAAAHAPRMLSSRRQQSWLL